jgi:hypothetical protein
VPQWLVVSLFLSIVLTVIVNVVLRVFPHASEWLDSAMRRLADDAQRRDDGTGGGQVRVIFPWKFMLVASIVLTLVLNLVFRLR